MGSAVHPYKDDDIVYSPNKYRETEGIKDTNDPTALFCGLIDQDNKKLWVFDEMYKKGMSNESIADKIKSMGYGKEIITADSAEPKSNDRLRTLGINRLRSAKKGKDSINAGIDFLQDYEIIIHPKCVNFITEIGNYQWDKDKFGNAVNKPIDDFNHCVTGDTLIDTSTGQIPIKELVGKIGEVYCFDYQTNKLKLEAFEDVRMTRNNADIFEVELEDGTTIKATSEHLFLTKKGWKMLKELTDKDEIIKV